VFDRAGVLYSSTFDIDTDPLQFIRLIVGLSFCSNDLLGYDPTITATPEGRFIQVKDKHYRILKTEYIADMIRGRGTVCYHAAEGDETYAIKDSWVDTGRPHMEVEFLKTASQVDGIPTYCDSEVVRIRGGHEDSTAWIRSCILPNSSLYPVMAKLEVRKHHRLIVKPFALPLTDFDSKFELLSVLRDVILSTCTCPF
jgi:hypothetical protein